MRGGQCTQTIGQVCDGRLTLTGRAFGKRTKKKTLSVADTTQQMQGIQNGFWQKKGGTAGLAILQCTCSAASVSWFLFFSFLFCLPLFFLGGVLAERGGFFFS